LRKKKKVPGKLYFPWIQETETILNRKEGLNDEKRGGSGCERTEQTRSSMVLPSNGTGNKNCVNFMPAFVGATEKKKSVMLHDAEDDDFLVEGFSCTNAMFTGATL